MTHADPPFSASATRAALLTRKGLVFVEGGSGAASLDHVRAVGAQLAELGYVLSSRLRARLTVISLDELTTLQAWLYATLSEHLGADREHVPLFRSFPLGVPSDTRDLWFRKVIAFYFQGRSQPCLSCGRVGTTHVLRPCLDVVCDHCFDGATYSACPVCERHVDRASPFFVATPDDVKDLPAERVTLKLLDLGDDLEAEALALFVGFCQRKQAMSPTDVDALKAVIGDHVGQIVSWLPETIPVKENVAHVFGALFRALPAADLVPVAGPYLRTATDILRVIAALSSADPALQSSPTHRLFTRPITPRRWAGKVAQLFAIAPAPPRRPVTNTVMVPMRVHRFVVARLSRSLRRALLALLDAMSPDSLREDLLRHRSYWVWVGEFLHPSEHAARYPNVASAFLLVRKKAKGGAAAPPFQTYAGKVDAAVKRRDAGELLSLLAERPGELARRFDHALRLCEGDAAAQSHLVEAFAAKAPAFSTPVLLTLKSLLPTRARKAPVRIYWPKGAVSKGVSRPDTRQPLSPEAIARAVSAVEAELLRRFAEKPGVDAVVIDAALRTIPVPFNERTASRSAVSLPRGSRLAIPAGKVARLFLHWCEPESGGEATDLDLSVAFYDAQWKHTGVCSYYALKLAGAKGEEIALSAGDLRNAPFPDGATELVDIHRDRALAAGFRYAVMVVNAYSGLAFGQLERGFAGLMLRDDVGGRHFDPRTVELKFALQGEHGVFLPLVVDLEESTLHWLDTFSKGQFELNNVETSKAAIARICPEMIGYFASGIRMSMYELALLHAAARGQRVFLRDGDVRLFVREPGEDARSFLQRLRHASPEEPSASLPATDGAPVLAVLYRGDLALPEGSVVYSLFREGLVPTLTASDLIS